MAPPSPLQPRHEWSHFDNGNRLIKNHYALKCITPLTHIILSLLCPALNISVLSFLSLRPPPPTNADLNLHTKLFSTILRHEFISIIKENRYQIVFVSLMYFSFSYLPIRRFDRQEKPFLTGPPLYVWGSFGSEEDEIF